MNQILISISNAFKSYKNRNKSNVSRKYKTKYETRKVLNIVLFKLYLIIIMKVCAFTFHGVNLTVLRDNDLSEPTPLSIILISTVGI